MRSPLNAIVTVGLKNTHTHSVPSVDLGNPCGIVNDQTQLAAFLCGSERERKRERERERERVRERERESGSKWARARD